MTTAKRKRASGPPTPSSKQTTLTQTVSMTPQKTVDKAIVNYVVHGLRPFSIVEQEPFRELVSDLVPNAKMMSRVTLTSKIEDGFNKMKAALTEAMKGVEYVATTTDCWSVRRRGFIGVTAHWIDPENLERCSAALACRQLRGSHTFERLANALHDIHAEFDIRGKIVRTTTDNGSNFLKAFRVFGEDENNNEEVAEESAQSEEEGDGADEEEDVEYIDTAALLNEDDGFEFQLPRHQRCACHLLNLIASEDSFTATSSDAYKKLHHATFGKCYGLWNKCGRSTLAAEMIEDVCSLQLLRPNKTRWNSLFMAVERLLRISKEKGEGALRAIATDLKVPM